MKVGSSYLQLLLPASLIIISAQSVTWPQDVIEPQGSSSHSHAIGAAATPAREAHASYQMYRWPFGSTSGSGHTVWYFSQSGSSIHSPPVISQSEPGHLYVLVLGKFGFKPIQTWFELKPNQQFWFWFGDSCHETKQFGFGLGNQ